MEKKTIRRLSLQEMQAVIHGLDEKDLHVYLNQNVAVLKQGFPRMVDKLLTQPFIIDEMRVMIIRQGQSKPIINLLPMDLHAGDLLFIGKNSTVVVEGYSDDVMAEGFSMSDELFRLAIGTAIPHSLDGHLRSFRLSLKADEMEYINRLIDLLYDTIRHTDYSSRVFLSLSAAFWWYLDSLYNTHEQATRQETDRDQQVFGRFISLVNEHARTQHNLAYYADRLCLSLRYMGTIVKQVSGRSAKEWIDEALVTAIKVDLRHTSKPLKQIADEMEFQNMSFFSKFFKRMTGLTPMEYRREALERENG
ncbi:MAG: AraC family transcriptional regulator [Prevotella sp.]|nr:AraC family transcriptional regulator [Prevotella sp.]